MVEDPKWELAILATVQGFYEKLLQESVGGEVPVPAGLEAISLQSDGSVLEAEHDSGIAAAVTNGISRNASSKAIAVASRLTLPNFADAAIAPLRSYRRPD